MEVGTILWAKNRPSDHGDHLHVEPKVKKSGTPPLTNPGMSPGVKAIYDALVVEFGPAYYFKDPKPPGAQWSHMGWYNRRKIAGTQTWSQHAYANAIDIGPYIGVAAQQRFFDFLTGITTPIGDDDMVLKQVLKGQTTAFYAEMQARVNVPAKPGDPGYWGVDGPGTPSEAEWDAALDDFVGALFQMAVWPSSATGAAPDLSAYSKVGHEHNVTGKAK